MKKILSVSLLCVCLLMCLPGCGKSTDWLSEIERTAIEESLLNEFNFTLNMVSPFTIEHVKLSNNTGYDLSDLEVNVNGTTVAYCTDFYEGRRLERAHRRSSTPETDLTVTFNYSIGGYNYTSPEYSFEPNSVIKSEGSDFSADAFKDYTLIIRADDRNIILPLDRANSNGFDKDDFVSVSPVSALNNAGTYWIWPQRVRTYSYTDIGDGMVDILLDVGVDAVQTVTMYGPQVPSKLLRVVARIVDENGMVLATDVLDENRSDCRTYDQNTLHFEFCTDSRILYLEFANG